MRYTSPMAAQKEDDLKFYRQTRKSNECACGRGKQPGMWFCYKCYMALPVDMRRALFGVMDSEIFEAYDEAVKYLEP